MKLSTFLVLWVCVVTVITPNLSAQDFDGMEDTELRNRIFDLGYYQNEFEGVTQMLEGIFEQLAGRQDADEVVDAVFEAYDEVLMETAIRNSIRRMYNREHAIRTLEHHSNAAFGGLNEKVFGLTLILEDEESEEDFQRYIEDFEHLPDYAERLDETERILQSSRILQSNLQRVEDILSTVIFGLNIALDEHERLSDREVNDLVITFRRNFTELFNNVLPYVILYATRDVPVEVLEQHADFLESDSGRWYIRTKNTATLDSFGEMTQRASESLAAWALERSQQQ